MKTTWRIKKKRKFKLFSFSNDIWFKRNALEEDQIARWHVTSLNRRGKYTTYPNPNPKCLKLFKKKNLLLELKKGENP